ncbi:hypothetical protein JCM16307_07510 [Thermococcus prieurii]
MRAMKVFVLVLLVFIVSESVPWATAGNVSVSWSSKAPGTLIAVCETMNQLIIASGTRLEFRDLKGNLLNSRDLVYPITDVELERNTWGLDVYVASGKFIHVFYKNGMYKRFTAPDSMKVLKVEPSPWIDRVLLLLMDNGHYYAYITNKKFSEVVFKLDLGTDRPLVGMTYDANYLAVAQGSELRLVEVSDGKVVWTKKLGGSVTALLVVDRGDVYVGTSGDTPKLQKLNAKTGKTEFSVPLLGTPVAVSIDWEGSYLAVAQKPGRLSLLSSSGNVLWEEDFSKEFGEVGDVEVSRSGRYIAATFGGGTLVLTNGFVPPAKFSVNAKNAKLIPVFTAQVRGSVYAVDADDEGKVLAVISYYPNPQGTFPDYLSDVVIMDSSGNEMGKDTFEGILRDVAVSGNGKYIAVVGDDHYLHVLNMKGDEVANRFFDFYSGGSYTVAISENGNRIAVGTFAGWTDDNMTEVANASIYYFTFDGSKINEVWKKPFPSPTWGTRVWGLSMDSQGNHLAVSVDGGYNNTFILSSSGKLLWESGERGYIRISKDGETVVYLPLPGDGIIRVQKITGDIIWTKPVSGVIGGFKFSRDFLVACLRDENKLISTIKIFSIQNGTEILTATFPGLIVDFAVSRNNYLLIGFENGTVEYYKIESTVPLPNVRVTLKIKSFPSNARVFVDGSYKGNTPLTLELEEGTYSIAIEKIGYTRWTSTVKLLAGETKTLNVTLEKVAADTGAVLEVTSTPEGAKVYLNREYAGVTPLNLTLEAGDYEVKLVKEGYLDWVKTVSLTPGSSEKVSAVLSEAYGVLEVTTSPTQSKVYVNGDYQGLSPLRITLTPGNYTVRIVREGYEDEERNVTIKGGEKTSLALTLVPLKGSSEGSVEIAGVTMSSSTFYYIGAGVVAVFVALVLFINRRLKQIEQKTTAMTVDEFAPKPASPTTFPQELSNKYTDVEFIGRGGFARVFKAKRASDGKVVAVKVPINLDEATGKSFIKELQNWANLRHPNIVELYDYNILPIPYLEMEYCDCSLGREKKPMDVKKAAWLIFNIAEGLKYAHNKKVIHRDLKPSNILLKNGVPKISDWGLSKVMTSSRSSTVAGFTPLYAAPEQISPTNFGGTDERTDIWQLGVVFYELVTGKLPFEASDFVELASKITTKDPVPPSRLNPEAKEVEHIIMKMLSKDKELRYKNMLELQRDLAIYLGMSLKEELKKSTTVGDRHRIVSYLGDLLLMSMKTGNKIEAYKYATDIVNYVTGELGNEFRNLAKYLQIITEEGLPIPDELIQKAEILIHKVKLGFERL